MANTQGKKKENRVRQGDMVKVLSGKHRGSEGKVMLLDPAGGRVELEIDGINEEDKVIKHQKRSQEFQNGAIRYLNPTVPVSNVMKLDRWNDRQSAKPAAKAAPKAKAEAKKAEPVENEEAGAEDKE